jgi:LuxR family maltose regulon positive regulatory protein
VIEANLLSALLADEHDRALSVRRLDAALDLLEATGIRAPFEMYADQVEPLLRRHAAAAGRHLGLTVGLLDRADSGAGGACVVEALTERELEILNHLPTLMSNVEVAESLHLSVNTVKSHLKAIYRKLGVEGRRQAVLRGRELELM